MKLLNVKKKRGENWGGGKKKETNIDDVALLAEKKDERKQKDEVRKLMYTDSQQVVRRQTSTVQKLLNEISKRRLKDPGEIAGFFTSKGIKMYDIPKEMYIAIASARVSNTGSVVLTDTIANKPLYFRSYVRGFTTRTITNDFLWLQLIYFRELESLDVTDDNKLLISLIKKAKIESSVVSSGPFICEREETIKKGYYQDFDGDFACIGMQLLDQNKTKELINKKTNKYEFDYNDNKYIAIGSNNSCVIYNAKANLSDENLLNKVLNTKVFSAFGKFELGPKEISFKSRSVRYLDFNLKPDNFCPAFLILNDNEDINLLMKLSLDYNSVFDTMDEYFEKFKKIMYEPDFCYWDTFTQYFDFMFIYYLTSPAIYGVDKNNLKDWLIKYIDYKPTLMLWKQLQLTLEKICVDYYNSFMSKIGYDKLVNLSKKIDNYIKNRNKLIAEGNFEDLKAFMDDCPIFSYWMKNQFKDFGLLMGDYIKEVLDDLLQNKYTNIVTRLKELGIAIYEHSYNPKMKDETSLFPVLLSEGAFLGSLYDERNINNPIAEIAKKINKNAIVKSIKETKAAKIIGNIINNVGEYQQKLIDDYIYSVYPLAKNEDITALGIKISDLIKNNKNLETKLNEYVASAAVDGKLKKKAYFNFGEYGAKQIVESYKLEKKEEENKKKEEEVKLKGEIINNQRKINDLENIEEEPDQGTIEWAANFFKHLSPEEMYDDGVKNYFATLIYLSSLYKSKTYEELLNETLPDMLKAYSLSESAIKYIILDHDLPLSFDKIKAFKKTEYLPRGIVYDDKYTGERDENNGEDENNLYKYPLTKKIRNLPTYSFRPTTVASASKDSPFVQYVQEQSQNVGAKREDSKKYDKYSAYRPGQSTGRRGRFKEKKEEDPKAAIVSALEGLEGLSYEDLKGKRSRSKGIGRSRSKVSSRQASSKRIVNIKEKK